MNETKEPLPFEQKQMLSLASFLSKWPTLSSIPSQKIFESFSKVKEKQKPLLAFPVESILLLLLLLDDWESKMFLRFVCPHQEFSSAENLKDAREVWYIRNWMSGNWYCSALWTILQTQFRNKNHDTREILWHECEWFFSMLLPMNRKHLFLVR